MATPITPMRVHTRFEDAEEEAAALLGTKLEVEEVSVVVEGEHTPILHMAGTLPKASGEIPPTFISTPFADQRAIALAVYTSLKSDTPQLLRLNEGTKVYTVLVNISKTKLVKVVFCPGLGSSPIGVASTPIDDKLLFLHGDGSNNIGPPLALCLPKDIVAPAEVNVMTEAQFTTAVTTKGAVYTYPLLPRN